MRTHEFILRIRLPRATAQGMLAASLLLGTADFLNPGQNTLKWTTYVPSPNGAFVNLTSNNAALLATNGGDVYLGGEQGCGFTPPATGGNRFTTTPPINCTDMVNSPRVVRLYDSNIVGIGGVEPNKSGARNLPILHIRGNIWVDRLFWSDLDAAGITEWPFDLNSDFTVDKCPNIKNCVITKNTTLTINWSITEAIIAGTPYPVKNPKTGETKMYKDYTPRFITRIGHATGGNLYVDLNPKWTVLQPEGGLPWLPMSITIDGSPNHNLGAITGQCTYTAVGGTDLKGTCSLKFPKVNNYKLGIKLI